MTQSFIARLCIALALISFILIAWSNHASDKAAMRACQLNNSYSTCHTLME